LNPKYNIRSFPLAEFELLFNQSVNQKTGVIGTDNPYLFYFKNNGGKLMMFHGLADEREAPQGKIAYFRNMQTAMGGADPTSAFACLFLVPGTNHSLSGAGASSTSRFYALIQWVEKGVAPEFINTALKEKTGKLIMTGNIYRYRD
jgi:feruloyl esterase